MVDYGITPIDVDNLLLDPENPRHEVLADQDAAMQEMLNEQGDKLLNLARDIAEVGVNPSELPIVMPLAEDPGKFVVLEGNRRVAAVKLLLDPSLATQSQSPSIRAELAKLSAQSGRNRVRTLRCIVVEQKEDAAHWIQLRHTGENNGVGVVGWDPLASSRFNERLGRSDFNSLALQVIDFMRNALLDEATAANLERVSATNLARLLNDPDVREVLGLRKQDGQLETDLPPAEVLKGLKRIVNDLGSGRISVSDIYYKDNRRNYMASFGPEDTPDRAAACGQTWRLRSAPATPAPIATKPATTQRGIPQPATARRTLIPTRLHLRIAQHRLSQIYRELRTLDVDRFPNCAAVMMRVFLELSVDEYASSHSVQGYSRGHRLKDKLLTIAQHMEDSGTLNKHQLKAVRNAASVPDALFSTETLNAYVHNQCLSPKPSELKMTWDDMQLFVTKLWE